MFSNFQWADLESSVRLTSVALNFGFCKQGLVTGSFKSLKKKKTKANTHKKNHSEIQYSFFRFLHKYCTSVSLKTRKYIE